MDLTTTSHTESMIKLNYLDQDWPKSWGLQKVGGTTHVVYPKAKLGREGKMKQID